MPKLWLGVDRDVEVDVTGNVIQWRNQVPFLFETDVDGAE